MNIITEDSKEALVFGKQAIRKTDHLTKKVRIDRKRTKTDNYRRIAFGDKLKVVNLYIPSGALEMDFEQYQAAMFS